MIRPVSGLNFKGNAYFGRPSDAIETSARIARTPRQYQRPLTNGLNQMRDMIELSTNKDANISITSDYIQDAKTGQNSLKVCAHEISNPSEFYYAIVNLDKKSDPQTASSDVQTALSTLQKVISERYPVEAAANETSTMDVVHDSSYVFDTDYSYSEALKYLQPYSVYKTAYEKTADSWGSFLVDMAQSSVK